MSSFPDNCPIGQTYFYAPDFVEGDFDTNINGVFTDDTLSFVGNSTNDYVRKSGMNPAGFKAVIHYSISDHGSSNTIGNTWDSGGMGIVDEAQNPLLTSSGQSGVEFVSHYSAPTFVIQRSGSVLWTSSPLADTVVYNVIETLTVSDVAVAGWYSLTVRLQVVSEGIDETVVITQGVPDTSTGLHLFIMGPTSPGINSAMIVDYLYLTGQGLPGTCLGPGEPPVEYVEEFDDRVLTYKKTMLHLLPTGPLWRNLNAAFHSLMEAFAVELARIHDLALVLLRESNPGDSTSDLLLSRWEDVLLLPEEKPLGPETEAERQLVVNAKLITSGGQSRAFYRALAANLGLLIDITEGGYWVPARVGTARVGIARTSRPGTVYIWNIRFLIDTFDGATVYWVYDGDGDFTSFPGYFAASPSAGSAYLTFQGGPLFPTWPIIGFDDPITVVYSVRCLFTGGTNIPFFVNSWSDQADYSTDYVFMTLFYSVADGTYQVEFFGTQNAVPYGEVIDTGIAGTADITLDFKVLITPTGFTVSIPARGFSHTVSGFVFNNLNLMDFATQRTAADRQGMFGALGVSSESQVAKFKLQIERLKPAHTEVTYN